MNSLVRMQCLVNTLYLVLRLVACAKSLNVPTEDAASTASSNAAALTMHCQQHKIRITKPTIDTINSHNSRNLKLKKFNSNP